MWVENNLHTVINLKDFFCTSEVPNTVCRFSLTPALRPDEVHLQSVLSQALPTTPLYLGSLHMNTPRSAPELSAIAISLIGPPRESSSAFQLCPAW